MFLSEKCFSFAGKLRKKSWEFRKNYSKIVDFLEKVRIISTCMDTQKECMIPKCGDLPDLTRSRVCVGGKQVKKAIQAGTAQRVFLAVNADPALTSSIAQLSLQSGIDCQWVSSMKDLGRACGIDVGAAAAAVIA